MTKINTLELLDKLGIKYQSAGQNVRTLCINPDHKDTNASMYIHKETLVYHCFGCGIKGSMFSFIGNTLGLQGIEAVQFIGNFMKGGDTEEAQYESLKKEVNKRADNKEVFYSDIIDFPSHILIQSHPYLEKRNIHTRDIQEWQMGIVNDKRYEYRGYLNWIYIPIYQNGILRTYFLRDPNGEGKRYGKYSRMDILAGYDMCNEYDKDLYLTEGIFDTISVKRTRRQCVAALSNTLTPEQLSKLKRYKRIVVVPDNDEQGKRLLDAAYPLIYNTEVCICQLPKDKKDAADCTIDELIESIYRETPIIDYMHKKILDIYTGRNTLSF